MTGTATWFGPDERPLFGWLHVPEHGRARGAVVLCPPLGLEGVCAHRTFRNLAERLALADIIALRFDYDGTGDSAGGQDDPGRVAAWMASVGHAVAAVRRTGAPKVVVVGMRVGATVAAARLAEDGGADGLVLWDACASGRAYLREQQALGLFSLGGQARPDGQGRPDGAVEVPGIVYGRDTVADLQGLSIAATEGALAARVLVLVRPERPAAKALRQRLALDHVEWGEAPGQTDLVDVEPWQAQEPHDAVDTVLTWVSDVMGRSSPTVRLDVQPTTEATVIPDTGTGAVVERIVAVGDIGLFGVVTEPGGERAGPAVILLNAGVMDHVGPARLWVDFARRFAAGGVRTLRFDLSGLGDSPARPGQSQDLAYPPEAFDDMGTAVASMGGPGRVTLMGLCSGGYHAIEGAMAHGVRSVCVINPILTASPSEMRVETSGGTPEVDPRRQATTARRRWVRALPAHDFLGSIVDRLPDPAWWLINRVAVSSPPGRIIERLVEAGVDTYVVCGDKEARVMRRGQAAAFRRLTRTGRFHLEVMPGIDHELFARVSRDQVEPVVTERILLSAARTVAAPTAWTRNTGGQSATTCATSSSPS